MTPEAVLSMIRAHLADRPVTLLYREDRANAPWVPIIAGQEATGRYLWLVPENVPARFHVKAEALDTLGNRGSADSQDTAPVLLDRARPRGRILGLDPSAGGNRQ